MYVTDSMSRLHEHSLPSLETEMRLWAFWVPTTVTQYTGCCGQTVTVVVVILAVLVVAAVAVIVTECPGSTSTACRHWRRR